MLETQLERIATALERLLPFVEQYATPKNVQASEPTPAAVPEAPANVTKLKAKTPTHAELKALCMRMVKEGKAGKDQIKAVLSGFNAATIADLKDDDLIAAKQALEALQ
jgi:mRNA-degrading endonuclease toxin of MazEF toxin-antitoxin module